MDHSNFKHQILIAFPLMLLSAFSLPVSAASQSLKVVLTDPSGAVVSSAPVEVYSATSKSGEPAKPLSVSTTDANGSVQFKLPDGKYLLAVKKSDVQGNISERFTATFYPLLTYFGINGKDKEISLQTLKMTIKDARIVQTDTFLQYYGDAEKGKRARLDGSGGHAGRVIKLVGSPVASLELNFPKTAVGVRGMRTYTPTSFEFLDAKNTLLVRTYMYDGKIKTAHNIMMLGTDLIPDGGNKLVIENVQEKSGVEVPFEPKATVINDGVSTAFVSNITFVSDENVKPAKLSFSYFYLDDQEVPFNIDAMISPASIR